MRAEKVSLTLDEELLAEAREIVGVRKLSSYVNRALRSQLQHDRVAGLLTELEREHGQVEPRILEEVRQAWPGPGDRASRLEAGGAQILTGDREDLERLAEAHPEVWIQPL
jgi:Arc/MetJ family transcription regulator